MFELTIAPNTYFVLGDDRNNSDDSHNGWTVPVENVIGQAWLVYWPPDRWRIIQHSSSYIGKVVFQPDRCLCLKQF